MPLTRKEGAPVPRTWNGSPFRILALDPGGTTGWAFCKTRTDLQRHDGISLHDFHFECGHLGPGEHHTEFWNLLSLRQRQANSSGLPLEIVCESFEFRQHINRDQAKTKVELMSKEYIGIVKLFNEIHDEDEQDYGVSRSTLTFSTASSAKSLVPDKGPQANVKLKQIGWYKPVTHWVHAMDATRHLLRYMVVEKRIREPITTAWLGD